MAWVLFAGLTLALSAPPVRGAGSSCANGHSPLVDNFRDIQTFDSHFRTLYRSSSASFVCPAQCDIAQSSPVSATCPTFKETELERERDTTTSVHWSYADQEHWYEFGQNAEGGHEEEKTVGHRRRLSGSAAHGGSGDPANNECQLHHLMEATFPGESPIDVALGSALASSGPSISLTGFSGARKGLPLSNDGYRLVMDVSVQSV